MDLRASKWEKRCFDFGMSSTIEWDHFPFNGQDTKKLHKESISIVSERRCGDRWAKNVLNDYAVDGREILVRVKNRVHLHTLAVVMSSISKGVKSCTLINKSMSHKKPIKRLTQDWATPQKRVSISGMISFSRPQTQSKSRGKEENFNIDGFLLFSCSWVFLLLFVLIPTTREDVDLYISHYYVYRKAMSDLKSLNNVHTYMLACLLACCS